MAYIGQPVPSTVTNIGCGKISDGKSVKVTVPENTTIEAGKFYLLDGFFGCAMQSVTTGVGQTAEVVLNIEQAERTAMELAQTAKLAESRSRKTPITSFGLSLDRSSKQNNGGVMNEL